MEVGREKGGCDGWVEGVALLWWCSAAQVALPQTCLLDFNNVMDYVVLNNYCYTYDMYSITLILLT